MNRSFGDLDAEEARALACAFYPQRLKGWALGLNAGGGNIGVPVIQLVGLLVIATVGNMAAELVCAVYLVLLAIVGIAFKSSAGF